MVTTVDAKHLPQWVGKPLEPGDWFKVEQDRINLFADATLDHQFIHVDSEKAAQTPFGTTIAHGFLTMSLLPYFFNQSGIQPADIEMAVNYGLNKARFINPVKVGSRVRPHVTLKEVKDRGNNQYLLTCEVSVEIEGEDKPAMIAETLMLFFVR
ncbi:MAG: MaoC family dehydratase [Rhodothalassiaceae bacterium]